MEHLEGTSHQCKGAEPWPHTTAAQGHGTNSCLVQVVGPSMYMPDLMADSWFSRSSMQLPCEDKE